MAPSPEYDKEPKAPDKSATNSSAEDTKVPLNLVNEQQHNSDHKATNTSTNADVENNKHVEALDDGQLRALLDEAITYKCPKDREGKSNLFKELLEEVEQDEQACEEAARSVTGARGRRARAGGSHRALPHSNSLQDLVAALAAEPPRRPHRPHHNVSARAIHGGSLPSGVDTSSLSEEPARAGYLATVRCVNPPPLAERRVSASDANAPHEVDALNRRSKPSFPMTYTARATLEIGSGHAPSGRALTTTTASNQGRATETEGESVAVRRPLEDEPSRDEDRPRELAKFDWAADVDASAPIERGCARADDADGAGGDKKVDSAIPFSCISSPEVVGSAPPAAPPAPLDSKPLQLGSAYRAVASLTGAAPPAPADPAPEQPRSVIASSFNGLPLARSSYGATGCTPPEDFKKSLDENGNSVQPFSSPPSGVGHHKKPRRKKSSRNETVIDCQQIDGYRGDKDVNELLRFIESGERGGKLARKHDDDKGKKRRKDKDKPQRASSLEEVSRTSLADLTAPAAPPKPERRSWGDDARPYFGDAPPAAPSADLADFQTVTKKRRPRRRTDEPARRARPPSPRAPPSDRSADSNDDMDSVHSLPALAAAPRAPAPSHASYADIARTRHNIPDLIESCNFYAEGDAPPEASRSADAPPPPPPATTEPRALDETAPPAPSPAARARPRDKREPPRRERKERAATAPGAVPPAGRAPSAGECPAPDVVADRRPPVVLLDAAAPRDMDGVTFGFDINEQLLGDGALRPRCDLVRDALEGGAGVSVRLPARACALRYVPPRHHDSAHLHQIIDYVAGAWEDALRCGGKARYFTE